MTRLDRLREIVDTKCGAVIGDIFIDVPTAAAILMVWENLTEAHRSQFMKMDMLTVGLLAHKLLAKFRVEKGET